VGVLLCFVLPTTSRLLILVNCVLASGMIEVIQSVLPGRQSSLRDVALNGAGAVVGLLIHGALITRLHPRPPDRISNDRSGGAAS
jgi:VanZ family protein